MDRSEQITFPLQNLRSPATAAKYEAHRETKEFKSRCALCQKDTLEEFTYWRIVDNSFPYDLIAETHHMLISKVHATERELPKEAHEELLHIKNRCLQQYDLMTMSLPKNLSIPQHVHYHLIKQGS